MIFFLKLGRRYVLALGLGPNFSPKFYMSRALLPVCFAGKCILVILSKMGSFLKGNLTEQVMKVLERIVDGLIRQVVSIDDSQFDFVPGRGTTDVIFVVR